MKIEHSALYVENLERAKNFFEEFFGGKAGKLYHNEKTGFRSYFITFDGGARLELMTRPSLDNSQPKEMRTGYAHLAFCIGSRRDVDSLTGKLRAAGYSVTSGPRVTGDGYYESCIEDAEGNTIELTANHNPWEEIELSDYENHMSLDSVKQMQLINSVTKEQLEAFPAKSVMILGIAGGNGLEHVDTAKYSKVYGIDINSLYLRQAQKRHENLTGILECLCIDLCSEPEKLPHADLVIANLLIEYTGCQAFSKAIEQISPAYVSCLIQLNKGDGFVSDSPYTHVFDKLSQVHHQMQETELTKAMSASGYTKTLAKEHPLPNGKSLQRLDFCRKE